MTMPSILPAMWDVPQEFRDRLGAKVGRQRVFSAGGHLLLVLHKPPAPQERERSARFFWRKPDGDWMSSDLGTGISSLNKHLDEFENLVEQCESRQEAATSAEGYFNVLEDLGPLHHTARNLHAALEEARKALPQERALINARDRAYEIHRTAELLLAETQHAVDYAIARRAEEQARASQKMVVSAHRLNLLAAFFFPLATLGTVFGMNLSHGLEQTTTPTPFITVIALGLAVGCLLIAFVIAQPRAAAEPRKPRLDARSKGRARAR